MESFGFLLEQHQVISVQLYIETDPSFRFVDYSQAMALSQPKLVVFLKEELVNIEVEIGLVAAYQQQCLIVNAHIVALRKVELVGGLKSKHRRYIAHVVAVVRKQHNLEVFSKTCTGAYNQISRLEELCLT